MFVAAIRVWVAAWQVVGMRDLLREPLWRAGDLGAPIPDSPHAVSVCLPTWRDNVGYEEQEPRVLERIETGYPRFVYNSFCRRLFAECQSRFARADEQCQAYPSRIAAERCAAYIRDQTGASARVWDFGIHDVFAVCFPAAHARIAMDFWQHTGEGISSRLAVACLDQLPAVDGSAAARSMRQRIADVTGVSNGNVFLYSSGMNAIYTLYRVLNDLFPGRQSVQFGFPYVDTLKVLEKFGCGVQFFPQGGSADLERLQSSLNNGPVSGLYTEFPSNPLLVSPDLAQLAALAQRHESPLIVDDTVASFVNVDLLSAADVICSSLTKFFSGAGDVAGGSLVINPQSPFHADISARLREDGGGSLWGADAEVLERNSRDFADRVHRINGTGRKLAQFLASHAQVERAYYPGLSPRDHYNAFRKPDGGYGGLLSIDLTNATRRAPAFYDALRVCKGPNLGTNYTLACPYTILAHYRELEFAEACGVSRYLIRISVGLEEPADLIARFEQALSAT
jgi:cystathionine gamma-synthase